MHVSLKLILFFVFLLWCAGIFIESLISLNNYLVFLLPFLQKTYSLVCHQEKSKLISMGVGETLTCARCTGIYLGLLSSSFLILIKEPVKRFPSKLLFIVVIPMVTDIVCYTLNIYNYSKIIAFFSGFLLGSVGFFYFYAGLKDFIHEIKH